MKLLIIISTLVLLLSINCYSQVTNRQGVSTFGIRPSGSLFTFGLPQNSVSGQQSVLSYFPFPFTSFPINLSTNKLGKTELSWLYGSFDVGFNITKLLQNDHILRGEIGGYYTCVPHSYSISDNFQFYQNTKRASIWQNSQIYSGLMASVMYTTKSKGRRIWGEARNYLQLGIRTMNYLSQNIENQEDWTFNGTGFKVQSEVINQKSFQFLVEIGRTYWRKTDDMRSLEMGIRIGIPSKNFTSNTITSFSNNQQIGENTIMENGAYIGFQISYNLPILQLQKPNKMPKADKIFCEMERKVSIKHSYKVDVKELNIELFDHEKEDGDIVSVCFNGQYLTEKHLLTNRPKTLTIKLLPNQQNVLTVFANNTGKEGANTSAIRFTLNGKQEQIILYADKKESEGIEFYY
jgi:hypothetical protein